MVALERSDWVETSTPLVFDESKQLRQVLAAPSKDATRKPWSAPKLTRWDMSDCSRRWTDK